MIEYIAVDEKLVKDVLDAKAVRRMYEGLDYYVVLGKIKIKGRWEYGRRNGNMSKVLVRERIDREKVREKYERKVCETDRK